MYFGVVHLSLALRSKASRDLKTSEMARVCFLAFTAALLLQANGRPAEETTGICTWVGGRWMWGAVKGQGCEIIQSDAFGWRNIGLDLNSEPEERD